MVELFTLMGFIDGLSICNISLTALFISLMYSAQLDRRTVIILGLSYIMGVFSSYLAVGLGFLALSVSLPTIPHIITRVGVSIMLTIGLANILSYFGLKILPTGLSSFLGEKAVRIMKRVGFTSSAIAGLMVGTHNLPCACTGGIYPTFIALISDSTFKLPYLILYNLFFVTPMITILLIASNKSVILRVRRWHQQNKEKAKLTLGIIMIIVGVILLGLLYLGAS
jgi:cytochrome c biogenesis protein CcdA